MQSLVAPERSPDVVPASGRAIVERRFAVGAGLLIPAGLVAAVVLSASYDDPGAVGGTGLISILPVAMFATIVMLTASFAYQLMRSATWPVLAAHIAAEVFLLHGIAGLLEQSPRFATAWLHVGFVSVYQQSGHGLTADARFFWPAFFTTVAYLVDAAGGSNALPLLRFAPVVFELAYVLPLLVIFTSLGLPRRARWMAAWLFVLVNWVGQDYFSPQALGELLLLCVLALVLTALRAARYRFDVLPRSIGVAVDKRAALGVLGIVATGCSALAMEHQFTPVILTLDLFGLLALGVLRTKSLPWLSAVVVIGWVSYAAEPYWVGHLSTMLGSGSVRSTVHDGVTARVRGSASHQLVVWVRIGFAATVWAAALAGGIRAWRTRPRLDTSAYVLAVVPFAALSTQSYGGEAVLRVYLYTLPFAVALAVALFLTRAGDVTPRRLTAFAAVAVALTPLFFLARFGNESFEQVRPTEVQAVQRLYELAPHGATLAALNPDLPWRSTHYADYHYESGLVSAVVNEDPALLHDRLPPNPAGTYLIVTTGQLTALSDVFGDRNWDGRVVEFLQRNGFRPLYSNADAQIFMQTDTAEGAATGGRR